MGSKDFLGILFSLLFVIVNCKYVLSTRLFFGLNQLQNKITII